MFMSPYIIIFTEYVLKESTSRMNPFVGRNNSSKACSTSQPRYTLLIRISLSKMDGADGNEGFTNNLLDYSLGLQYLYFGVPYNS
jgi:hypothetical protein